MLVKRIQVLICFLCIASVVGAQRPRDYGIKIGILPTGEYNAITDVPGVTVGHTTLIKGDTVNTGVTAIIPHDGNVFQEKVPAAMFLGNGFGKMTGYVQVRELGNIETPVILTNTLSVPTAANALIDYTLQLDGNERVRSVNPIVGETNDGGLNDIRNRHITRADVIKAINTAKSGPVDEGNIGAGAGTSCFGFKGGIGSSSRVVPDNYGGYTVGVLVQSNFGGILTINGVPVGIELGRYSFKRDVESSPDGSCMIIVFTDAPLDSRNLRRLASRAMLGLARTGGIASNGSGDFVIAVSTAEELRIPYTSQDSFYRQNVLRNDRVSILFEAVIEATEEAIINSLFAAETVKTRYRTVNELPVDEVLKIMKKYNRLGN
jgi:D-aminopeptidase